MHAMSKRKQPDGPEPPPRPPASRSGVPLYVWIDEALAEAFQRYLDATRPRASKTAAVELALQNLLRESGFWPPPG
jgi:hypothetical protein